MAPTQQASPASLLEVTWADPVTGTRGYVVIDKLVRGLASGGLRMRKGCTLEEVRGLAQGMTRKEMLVYDPADHYIPLGGGKGGLDIDPGDPQAPAVLSRFVATVRPIIMDQWNTGEDLGTQQDTLDKVFADLGMPSTIEAVYASMPDAGPARRRLGAAAAVDVSGVPLMELVGGYGVARACVGAAAELGIDCRGATAVVQGFGSIGGAAARYLTANGFKVIAVADSQGLMRNDDGLDVEAMLAARDAHGVVNRAALGDQKTRLGPREAWLDIPCDLLVPCATSYVIHADDVDRIKSRVVVEGANMPTLPDAEARLVARGIPVVPDFSANVMTNAWWWWVIFDDIAPTEQASFAKIDKVAARLAKTIWADARASGLSLRQAAQKLVDQHAGELIAKVGVTRHAVY